MTANLVWPAEKSVEDRAQFAARLARMIDAPMLHDAERKALTYTLTLASEDPSPKVRQALADAISSSANAPIALIARLATDRPDIAGLVLARSPVIGEEDLYELARRLDPRLLPILAARVRSDHVAAGLLELADASTAVALLLNPDLALSQPTLEVIAETFGEHARVRELMLQRDDLPISARYALVERLCAVLSASGLVSNVLGANRTRAIIDEAQGAALIRAVGNRSAAEVDLLVAELGERAGIDATMLLRALCFGEPELFRALVCRLSGVGSRRARAMLRASRKTVVRGLFEQCGLSLEVATLLTDVHAISAASDGSESICDTVLERCRPACTTTATMLASVRRWNAATDRRYDRRTALRAA